MKKIILLALIALSVVTSYAKDKKAGVEIKDDSVLVDGKASFIFEKIKYLPGTFNYFVKDLSGKKLAFLKFYSYKDPKEISSANPNGNVNYYEVTFLESNQKAEIPVYARQIKMAELLVRQNLIQDGTITEESEQEFILVNGNAYSQKRNELGNNSTIIINNNTNPTQKNGVNFNIGR